MIPGQGETPELRFGLGQPGWRRRDQPSSAIKHPETMSQPRSFHFPGDANSPRYPGPNQENAELSELLLGWIPKKRAQLAELPHSFTLKH